MTLQIQHMENTMNDSVKQRAPRKVKTAAELKADLEKAKALVAELEQRAYAGELEELVNKSNVVKEFNAIKASIKGASDLAILAAIGKAVGIQRLVITQAEPKKRVKSA